MNFTLAEGSDPDLILRKTKIWTGSPSAPFAEALAIRSGRIVAVGTDQQIQPLAGKNTRVLCLPGRLVVPGLIDNHTHFLSGGFQLLSLDLRDARNEEEVRGRLAQRAARTPAGRWITGGKWDHESWPGARIPTREIIDPATPRHPVFVERLDGHMGLANSLALKLAGITRDTPVPPGGEIVKNPATGEPTGILKDAAMGLVDHLIPAPTPAEEDEALKAAMSEASRLGVTSVQDVTSWNDLAVYQRARQKDQLTLRIYCRTPLAQWEKQAAWVRQNGAGDEWIRMGGLKAFMDGSLGSTTAYFFAPYQDAPETSGLLADEVIPQSKMIERIRAADRAGLQLSIHAIGDKANHLLLDFYEDLLRVNGPCDRRPRIEHAQHLDAADRPRFSQLQVIASVQPTHLIDDGRWAGKRLGPQRVLGSYVFRSLLELKAMITFGSDWPVASLDPLLGFYAAVTRRTSDGKHPEGWIPSERISLEEALTCYTRNNAYGSFEESLKGTLEKYKLADITVFNQDLFSLPPEKIREAKVLYTIVDGKIVYQASANPTLPN